MADKFFWGKAPQQEYTEARLCPGPLYSEIGPHMSRWWRFVDAARRDGYWTCCACDWRCPEVSPVDFTPSALPARGRARTLTV